MDKSNFMSHVAANESHQAIIFGVKARSGYVKVMQTNLEANERLFLASLVKSLILNKKSCERAPFMANFHVNERVVT